MGTWKFSDLGLVGEGKLGPASGGNGREVRLIRDAQLVPT